ncbi:hypothetical protein TNCV_3720011 [Trichonephila clavipes]|nr:hypothetical protein TNCV_3720011 [Trichonephila clavipes]
MRRSPKNGERRGNKRRQRRDVGGAKHEMRETARTTNDTDESGRKQELQKRRKWNRNKTSSMVHSSRVLDI